MSYSICELTVCECGYDNITQQYIMCMIKESSDYALWNLCPQFSTSAFRIYQGLDI